MQKWAYIDFELCSPSACDRKGGICIASQACTHHLLEQEEPFETPALLSSRFCSGCRTCARAFPLSAIRIEAGY